MDNLNEKEMLERESDPEAMRELAVKELETLNHEEYEKWFTDTVNWWDTNMVAVISVFKKSYPEYYDYCLNENNQDMKRIDGFTDGIDLLLSMQEAAKNGRDLYILSMQREYVNKAIERMKQMLN